MKYYVTDMRPLIQVESICDQVSLFREILMYIFAELLQTDVNFLKINIHYVKPISISS